MKNAVSRLRLPLAAIFMLTLVHNAAAYEPTDVYIRGLVRAWSERPAVRNAVGFALSVAFVEHPERFLAILDTERDVFHQWLNTLHEHTAERNEPAEPERGSQIYRQIRDTAGRWQGPAYRELIGAILRATDAR